MQENAIDFTRVFAIIRFSNNHGDFAAIKSCRVTTQYNSRFVSVLRLWIGK